MTRRERMERRLERREEWAEKAKARAASRFGAAAAVADQIPLGQPILVGHHSERRARRDAERITSNMERGVAETKLAEHHRAKAEGIAAALERSVFSDDPDAIEALERRIAEREAEADAAKRINTTWRKLTGSPEERARALMSSGILTVEMTRRIADAIRFGSVNPERAALPGYYTANLRANIRRDRERLAQIRARAADEPTR